MVYNEMKELGLLKKETIREVELDSYGNVIYDKYGNKKYKILETKNFRVANEHKNSRAKTYFIQEDVLENYLNTITK